MNPLLKFLGRTAAKTAGFAAREAAWGGVRLAQGVGYGTLYVGKHLPYLIRDTGRTIGNLFGDGSMAGTAVKSGKKAAEFLGYRFVRPVERGWDNLFTGVALSPLAKGVIAGGVITGSLLNVNDAVPENQLGLLDSNVAPLPATSYEGDEYLPRDKTMGATGDLVFALNALRRG